MKLSSIPRATARLQLHADFGFARARARVPYFAALGISHLYLSPITTARAGSKHGYDVVDHNCVSRELGGEEQLRELVSALRAANMGLIVDVVSNHMAVGEADNNWWLDILEWGRASRYANYFDIDWDVSDPTLSQRVLAPFLGKPYGEALRSGDISLNFDPAHGKFFAAYFSHRFPLTPRSLRLILPKELQPALAAALKGPQRHEIFQAFCRDLARSVDKAQIASWLAPFDVNNERGRERLHQLLELQHYRLAWFRTAADEINWRRFFDVTQLAGLRVEEPAAFEAIHAMVLRLFADGLVDGLRIDHVDGLADPRTYCRKLRTHLARLAARRPASAPPGASYLIVEKILAPGERLPPDWQVDGTTGYSFMNDVGAVLHDANGEAALSALWNALPGRTPSFDLEQQAARRRISLDLFTADFNRCAEALHRIARADLAARDWSLAAIRRVLLEMLVQFPVYRTYADARGRSEADRQLMEQVCIAATPRLRPGEESLLALLDGWLGGIPPLNVKPVAARRLRLRAIARFQQLTAPVAAKAVEDTAFYRHGRLLSRNEVGADPAEFSLTPDEFHLRCAQRLSRYPHTMLATATHDHKRGEDLRARLAVISEIPQEWGAAFERWREANGRSRSADGAPDARDEYMLYQMLVGAWPLDLSPDDASGLAALETRLAQWQQKALREAKRRSGWIEPNVSYEKGSRDFLQRVLASRQFRLELHQFAGRIAAAGAVNGLAQALLRMTTPGVPDLYQGTEFWDFSLVDPDNRREVDFDERERALKNNAELPLLLRDWRDGRIKQRVIRNTLQYRTEFPALFAEGSYEPVTTRGVRARNILAFIRRRGEDAALIVIPLGTASLLPRAATIDMADAGWSDTALELPVHSSVESFEVLSQRRLGSAMSGSVPVTTLLTSAPLALVKFSAPLR